jgi:pimeloyl-ACP methyl ester carboxylesterase
MPMTSGNGLSVYYELDDVGDPVVLIAGLTCDHTAWAPQVPALRAAGFRCLVFDNRDVGRSGAGTASYTIRDFAHDTLGIMDTLHIDSAHIVGASMGGMIAQELVLLNPHRARSLTLVCTTAATDAALAGVLRAWRAAREPSTPLEFTLAVAPWLMTHRFLQNAESVQGLLQMVQENPFPQDASRFARQCDAIMAHDAASRLHAINVPTHVIVGTEDVLTPPHYSRKLAGLIPNAQLTEVAKAGHALFWENVPEFNATMLGFLAEHATDD